jgi:hypothetical protein
MEMETGKNLFLNLYMKKSLKNAFSVTTQSKILHFAVLISLVLFVACDGKLKDDPESRPIRQNITGSTHGFLGTNKSPDLYRVEKTGLDELAASLEIDGFQEGFNCLCGASQIIYFYNGEKLVQVLGLNPDESLSWVDSGWLDGDARLSNQSRSKVRHWIESFYSQAVVLPQGAFKPPQLE